MKKIVHIITGLGSGGAENMLYKLLKNTDKDKYYHEVITLIDEGVMGEKIKAEGIRIHSLNLTVNNFFGSLIMARNICKDFDIVNTWLYHADIFGFIIAKVLLRKRLIWNIRHSNLDKEANKSRTLKIIKVNSILSRFVNAISYNSIRAFENHKNIGYVNKKSINISNGFDLDRFKFEPKDRIRIRKELSLLEEDNVLLTVGRWNIQKDYYTLVKALNELKAERVNFKMIMVGNGLNYSNKDLLTLIDQFDLSKYVILLGQRTDIPAVLSAADVYVSSSLGESFSNAIAEAMACQVPCVVTDVGDSKLIVDDSGFVVKPKDYLNLAKKILELINGSDYRNIGLKARARVVQKYDIKEITKIYEKTIFDG
ncbi:glycosyltransferase [Mesobacillus thioparans]|uniref:glycosyltransferase n=1 Tax=Mesobacillus thioparans TaxID=370439 RepID=UPI0039EF2A61